MNINELSNVLIQTQETGFKVAFTCKKSDSRWPRNLQWHTAGLSYFTQFSYQNGILPSSSRPQASRLGRLWAVSRSDSAPLQTSHISLMSYQSMVPRFHEPTDTETLRSASWGHFHLHASRPCGSSFSSLCISFIFSQTSCWHDNMYSHVFHAVQQWWFCRSDSAHWGLQVCVCARWTLNYCSSSFFSFAGGDLLLCSDHRPVVVPASAEGQTASRSHLSTQGLQNKPKPSSTVLTEVFVHRPLWSRLSKGHRSRSLVVGSDAAFKPKLCFQSFPWTLTFDMLTEACESGTLGFVVVSLRTVGLTLGWTRWEIHSWCIVSLCYQTAQRSTSATCPNLCFYRRSHFLMFS